MATNTHKIRAEKVIRRDATVTYRAKYHHPDYTYCPEALRDGRTRCDGHRKGCSGFKTGAEAEAAAYAKQAELAAGGKPVISTDADTVTMNEVCGLWMSTLPNADIIERTKRGYSERWRAMTNRNAVIGLSPVASISKARIVGWLSDSREAGHSDSTMKQDLILLRHIAQYAVLLDLIADDFTAGIKPPSSVQGKPEKRVRLKPAEVEAVAAHIGCTLGDAILLDLYTGLRLSELLGLKDSKLTRGDNYVLRITEQWDERAKTYRLPKRDKTRDVPVTTELHKRLDKHLLQYPASQTEYGIMFATRNGTHFLQSNFRKVWNRALRELRLPHCSPHCSPHSIRATCVDLWIDRGVSFENVATMVGHSSPDITRNVYYRDLTIDDTMSAILSAIPAADDAPLAEVVSL